MFRINDGREGENAILLVIYDRIDRCITDDGEIFCNMLVTL